MIAKTEAQAAKLMPKFIKPGTRIYADMGTAFSFMKEEYPMRRIKHMVEFWRPGISTNNAECFFSVLRRAERGIYHHVAGRYFEAYVNEAAWRQDRRRVDTKKVFEDLCGQVMVPFIRRCASSLAPVAQKMIEKPIRAIDFAPTTRFERGIKVRSAHVRTGELAPSMLAAWEKRRRAAIAKAYES